MGNVNRVNIIIDQIQKLQRELEQHQDKCPHLHKTIRYVNGNDVRWVCDDCKLPTDWPSEKDLKKWVNSEKIQK